jgi:hypothetical protein
MAKVKYTIQTTWSHQGYSDVIEIDDEELEGLDTDEREKRITEVVEEVVNNVVSWGWDEQE